MTNLKRLRRRDTVAEFLYWWGMVCLIAGVGAVVAAGRRILIECWLGLGVVLPAVGVLVRPGPRLALTRLDERRLAARRTLRQDDDEREAGVTDLKRLERRALAAGLQERLGGLAIAASLGAVVSGGSGAWFAGLAAAGVVLLVAALLINPGVKLELARLEERARRLDEPEEGPDA